MRLTQWIEDSTEGVHPPGSYEAQMAIRRVFAVLNPGKDFDETQARLKAERGDRGKREEPAKPLVKCKICPAMIPVINDNTYYCGPCSATVMQMGSTNRPGIAAMANKARKYQR